VTRSCSGAWIETLNVLHDSAEYGVLRWPLAEIAQVAHVPVDLLRELHAKGVLNGCDSGPHAGYTHDVRHARQVVRTDTLLAPCEGPVWYSRRFVKDEWKHQVSGGDTRLTKENRDQQLKPRAERIAEETASSGWQGDAPAPSPSDASGAGASSSSSTSSSTPKSVSPRQAASPSLNRKKPRTPLPTDFGISERVRQWALKNNYGQLEDHLEAFKLKCEKADYRYVNWDSAFMEAIRDDWAELRKASGGKPDQKPWYITQSGIIKHAATLVPPLHYEETQHFHEFRDAVYARAGIAQTMVQAAMREFMPAGNRK
jgi:hypothetical protein